MSSLGTILAGGGVGAGLGQLPKAMQQGAFDRQKYDQAEATQAQQQGVWDFQNAGMARTMKEQAIGDTVTPGATDEERMLNLAKVYEEAGMGAKAQEARSKAAEAKRKGQLDATKNGASALLMQQFGPATEWLNKAGIFGNIHSIRLADDVPQDPKSPIYSVYTAQQDQDGNTVQGPHVHVPAYIAAAVAENPGVAAQLMERASASAQKTDVAAAELERKKSADADRARHQLEMEGIYRARAGNAGAGSNRSTDFQRRMSWALKQIGIPGGFASEKDAIEWAQAPGSGRVEARADLKAAAQLYAATGGDPGASAMAATGVRDIAQALRQSPIANPPSVVPKSDTPQGNGVGPSKFLVGQAYDTSLVPSGSFTPSTKGQNPRFPKAVWSDSLKGWFVGENGKLKRVE